MFCVTRVDAIYMLPMLVLVRTVTKSAWFVWLLAIDGDWVAATSPSPHRVHRFYPACCLPEVILASFRREKTAPTPA